MNLTILTPVYEDWESFAKLTHELNARLNSNKRNNIRIVAVNDNSILNKYSDFKYNTDIPITVLDININIGHQRAIAIGLSYIAENIKCDNIIVIDSDGEDRPEDIEKLFDALEKEPSKIVFARRAKREESIIFKMFYFIYKNVFSVLTGKTIAFGNFCIIPYELLKKLVYVSEIWNHFSGGVIRSKIPYTSVATKRGRRYFGTSKMSFNSLIIHGISSIAVHIDTVVVRLLVAAISFILLFSIGIIIPIILKYVYNMATPGWATTVIIGFMVIISQSFITLLILLFIILSYRNQSVFIPALNYKTYISSVQNINS